VATERPEATPGKTVRVLAVGNSFSEDAVDQYFHELCKAAGKEVIVGDLYIPGCSLERHLDNARSDTAAYRYRRIGVDGQTITSHVSLSAALGDDEWDYVSFQQASSLSGLYESYAPLKALMAYVDSLTPEKTVYMWHQTWAYSPDSDHEAFPSYNSSQSVMYDSIMSASRQVMVNHPQLGIIIPCGTAIQTARATSGDADFTRDGYHLAVPSGRYIAACTWFEAIFKESVVGNSYAPEGMSAELVRVAQEAAHAANEHPFGSLEF